MLDPGGCQAEFRGRIRQKLALLSYPVPKRGSDVDSGPVLVVCNTPRKRFRSFVLGLINTALLVE